MRRNDAVTPGRPRRARRRRGADLARARARPQDAGASMAIVTGLRRAGAAAVRRVPRPPGDRRGVRRAGRPRAGAAARQDQRGAARRHRRAGRAAVAVHRDPLPLAGGRARTTLPAEIVVTGAHRVRAS